MESIFESKEQYFEFVKNWKKVVNSDKRKDLTLQHFILYRMLKRKDWKKCLSENSKEETVDLATYWAESCDVTYLSLWPFKGVTSGMIKQLRINMENA